MAAVYMATRQGRLRSAVDTSLPTIEFPPEEETVIQAELHRQVISSVGDTWQRRKVCLSKDKLLIGKPASNEVIDYIPLKEILTVASKTETANTVENSIQQGEKKFSIQRLLTLKIEDVSAWQDCGPAVTSFSSRLQEAVDEKMFIVTTMPGGHNSGNPTVLLASSKQERDSWVSCSLP
eukprot:766516-Hanusia_phi.AAC.2